MTVNATMTKTDETRGAVRVEDVYDTDIADLWQACTDPERLARWIAEVTGDLRVGGTIRTVFTSTATGSARIDACDEPHHLLITSEPGTDEEAQIEAWLTAEGDRTRLVVEERGLPLKGLHFYGAGWQAHLEDLGRSLAMNASVHPDGWSSEEPSPVWRERWEALTPQFEARQIG
ncbi:SRPBCC family protein [Calidifontibacter sp. DB0510]|uniref:SRPBCC family protein n=1 Tax=Metallococcus carri TaxID=1656884 RepID=A0A967E947_9MICO|nr:SRPBCC family protein [Metallococcus carri]NHN54840.1 SRPBCC family protein [Metallococcus carri]NOP37185.1 SRPBCC family protein [Calidifontibacter sp. DB2511S]